MNKEFNKYETLNFYPSSQNKKRYSEGGLRINSEFKKSLPNIKFRN